MPILGREGGKSGHHPNFVRCPDLPPSLLLFIAMPQVCRGYGIKLRSLWIVWQTSRQKLDGHRKWAWPSGSALSLSQVSMPVWPGARGSCSLGKFKGWKWKVNFTAIPSKTRRANLFFLQENIWLTKSESKTAQTSLLPIWKFNRHSIQMGQHAPQCHFIPEPACQERPCLLSIPFLFRQEHLKSMKSFIRYRMTYAIPAATSKFESNIHCPDACTQAPSWLPPIIELSK